MSLHTRSKRIIWFLVGNPGFVASSRIHGLRTHEKLATLGYHSLLAYTPYRIEEMIPYKAGDTRYLRRIFQEGDMVVLQKLKNEVNIPFFNDLHQIGVKLVFIDCDFPISPEVGKIADTVICTSRRLAELYKSHGVQALYIEDSPESFVSPRDMKKSGELLCYWFGDGSDPKWQDVEKLSRIIGSDKRLERWRLVTISNHPDANIQWHPEFLQDLLRADAIAIPVFQSNEALQTKSANRLLQSMALSLPVICSPLPSYLDIVKQFENGIICHTEEDWINAFVKLENDSVRSGLAKGAFNTALPYDLDNNIQNWIQALRLDDQYRDKKMEKPSKIDKKTTNYFYRKLLQRNTYYWNMYPFSLANFGVYLKSRVKNVIKKFNLGSILLWC